MLIDTHCHIHEADYPLPIDEVIGRAKKADVNQIICIGTDETSSRAAIKAAAEYGEVLATVGAHPYYAEQSLDWLGAILQNRSEKIVAIGEIGLDYNANPVDRNTQIEFLEKQIDLAIQYNLPISFHVRDAYEDFWSVLDNFSSQNIRGVLHCFTGGQVDADKALSRGLFFALNGISTFTRDGEQRKLFANLPLDRIMLETDAPFLTPVQLRGKIKVNEPAFIREIAEYNSELRQMSFGEFAAATTSNARTLFNLK